eukprot:2411861-Karenia_brevis.AAC.1
MERTEHAKIMSNKQFKYRLRSQFMNSENAWIISEVDSAITNKPFSRGLKTSVPIPKNNSAPA